MLRVGLTGGIASGKTTAAELFARHGVAIIDADQLARELVVPGQAALQEIVGVFGEQVLQADGSLDRGALRRRVFDNPDERRRLEAILHPLIRRATQQRSEALAAAGAAYVVNVVPLLLETDQQSEFDRIVVVDVPEELQLQRLMARDHLAREEAERMLRAQASRRERLRIADDVLDNAAAPQQLEEQVVALHRKYLELA